MSMNTASQMSVYVVTISDDMVKSYAKVEGNADGRLINACRGDQSHAAMLKDGTWTPIAGNRVRAAIKAGYLAAIVTCK